MQSKAFQIILVLLLVSIYQQKVYAQYCEPDKEPHRKELDTNVHSVKEYFLHGVISGHVRNYFMSTINRGDLTDHYANATGGALAYSTASWRGLHFGVKGIFTYNTFSSELAGNDSLNIAPAKWEQELFDITHPEEKTDLDRLEELYIALDRKKIHALFGKIDIDEGPLLKRRDGRMKPFVFKGLWTDLRPTEKLRIYNGYIWGVSPRGMTEWYTMNEVIGILNNGRLNDSIPMDYHEASGTNGLIVNGIRTKIGAPLTLSIWNYHLHKINNTSWFQLDYAKKKLEFGVQYVHQFGADHQNNLSEEERYFHPERPSHTVSVKAGFIPGKKFEVVGAQLFSLGEGRFVFPKELNRDGFYTSIPRSWMDGLGQTQVSFIGMRYYPSEKLGHDLRLQMDAQYVNVTSCDDHDNNKYNIPDYAQMNLSLRYNFKKALEGLHLNVLYVMRTSPYLPEDLTLEEQYYKTNLHHFNIVIDMVF